MIKVLDLRTNEDPSMSVIPRIEDYEELQTWCDARVDESQGWAAAGDGDLVWKLTAFYLRTGIASFIAKFLDANENPVSGIAVVHSWPGAPGLPGGDIVPNYSGGTGVVGFTNASGDAGFPYSHGMLYSGTKPFSGIGLVWPLVPTHLPEPKYADCAKGLGWFGGTDHLTVNPVFQLMRKSDDPGPGPGPIEPPVPGDSFIRVWHGGVEAGRISIVEGTVPSGADALQIYVDNQYRGEVGYA